MKKMVLVGGGRWGRVLAGVLLQLLDDDWTLLWLSRHGRSAAQQWCRDHATDNARPTKSSTIELIDDLSDEQLDQVDAAVVATSPHTHAQWLLRLLAARIPTFCEKPLVLDDQQAHDLEQQAIATACPVGVNLELHFASYMDQFVEKLSKEKVDGELPQHVELQWLDPWSEVRYGETKYSDVYTNIVDDMFPHCWSLLRRVCGATAWRVEQVEYSGSSLVRIALSQGRLTATVQLSRRAEQRTRRLRIECGTGDSAETIELDFSSEPGFIQNSSQRELLAWQGDRPLTRSLQSFLDVVEAHAAGDTQAWQNWPLSIVACGDAVRSSTEIAAKLTVAQERWLSQEQSKHQAREDDFRERLLFDLFMPLAANQGWRVEFTDPAKLREFYGQIERHLTSGLAPAQFSTDYAAQP